jgi:glutamate formiminotransferase
MQTPTLLAVPNVSEGRDRALIDRLAGLIEHSTPPPTEHLTPAAARLLDVHSDADHNRSVFSFAAPPRALGDALLRLAAEAVAKIDVLGAGESAGQHPHVGALDVAPVVYRAPEDRGAACAEALVIGERIGTELGVPVFLYGELTEQEPGSARTRADFRRGGVAGIAARIRGEGAEGLLTPDFGPPEIHPTAGATLVAARPPLVAFNLQLAAPATLADARHIAALVREGGEHGLPGLRAIGVELDGGVAQVSMNVERPFELSLAEVARAVGLHAPIADAELVGLAPALAFDGFPEDLPFRGPDPAGQLIENHLGS